MRSRTQLALLERELELAGIAAALDEAANGDGRLVVIEAAAGLGKTGLLEAAVGLGRERGLYALTARGSELERDFPFGIVRQLLEAPLAEAGEEERQALLTGAAALSRPLFENHAAAVADPTFGMLHALYWLVSNLACSHPLVVAVDDVHWADPPSLRFLAFLLPRLEELAVALLVTLRTAEPGAERPELVRLSARPEALALRPSPLSARAVSQLLAAGLGAEPAAEFTSACHAATAGNPFYLQAILFELAARGVKPTAEQAAHVRALGPRAVSRSVLLRLRALAPEAPAFARAVSVLGDGAAFSEAAELAGLDERRAAEVCDLLAKGAILKRSERLEFVHPIVREAVFSDLAPRERAAHHARAARALAAAGAAPERVAAQLLATEPAGNPWVVEKLRGAWQDALSRGAPEAAISFLRRALAEPPPPAARAELLLALGGAEASIGWPDAVAHLRDALAVAGDPRSRALISRELALILGMSGAGLDEPIALLETAIASVACHDRELALELEAQLAALAKMETRTAALARERLKPLRAKLTDRTPAQRALLGELALQRALEGAPADEAAALAQRALRSPRWLLGRYADAPQYFQANFVLVTAERFELAERNLAQAVSDARAAGSAITLAVASFHRSRLAYRRGAVPDAEVEASTAFELQAAQGWRLGQAAGLAYLIDALVERGELEYAHRLLAEHGFGAELPDGITFNVLLDSRGALRLAQRRWEQALVDLLEYGRRERDWQARNPAFSPYRSRAALALSALGKHEEARHQADEELGLARAFGAPRAIGIALRACGLVLGGEHGIEFLRQAVAVLEPSEARLEHARALTELGAALRRANRRSDARQPLASGLELARGCGATTLAQRAHDELKAAGARPRRLMSSGVESLTASERRVVQMAADGLTNPQIAQALFVTLKTVETHLINAYRKLHVRSRSELPALLAGNE